MILYIEKPKGSTQKLLKLIGKFSKVAGYKVNTLKSVTSQNTSKEILEKEYKHIIHFNIKYLGIKLTKAVKGIYAENYKTLIKLKRIQINGKIFLYTERNNII